MKTTQKYLALPLLMGIILVTGCDDDFFDCEKGHGGKVTRELSIPYFDRVQLNVAADVYITQGPDFSVVAEGQDNIIDLLERDVKNQEWEIEFDRCVRNYDKLDIYITMPEIREITLAGSGDIFGENTFITDDIMVQITGSGRIDLDIEADHIDGRIPGSGRLYLSGITPDLDFTLNGSGDLSAFGLTADRADVSIYGSGDAEVHVLSFLKVRIPGSGNVYYRGTPDLDIDITGSGSVINAN